MENITILIEASCRDPIRDELNKLEYLEITNPIDQLVMDNQDAEEVVEASLNRTFQKIYFPERFT